MGRRSSASIAQRPTRSSEERLKYLTDESQHQGRNRDVQRPRRPSPHAGLRQDSSCSSCYATTSPLTAPRSARLHGAARKRSCVLGIDWSAFYWGPADIFGPGKVLVFGEVIDKSGEPYAADIRSVLKVFGNGLHKKHGYTINAANEIEGFLFRGL